MFWKHFWAGPGRLSDARDGRVLGVFGHFFGHCVLGHGGGARAGKVAGIRAGSAARKKP